MKRICHYIRGGEASAAKRFCNLASILLDSIGNFLQKSIDNQLGDLFDRTHPMDEDSSEEDEGEEGNLTDSARVEELAKLREEDEEYRETGKVSQSFGIVTIFAS